MASKITVTFNNPAQEGDVLSIIDSFTPSILIFIQFSSSGFSLPITGVIDQDITNVFNLLENGYNSTNRYIITTNYVLNTIVIEDNIGNTNFSITQNNTLGRLTTLIENVAVVTPITIDDVTLIQNADPCNLVNIQITTNQQATNITSPVIQAVSTNPFTITNIPRDAVNDIVITLNDASTNVTQSIYVPVINSSLFDLQIVQSPSSSVLNVVWLGLKQPYFSLQYSLDNVAFYDSSSFSGLAVGNYTLYVKDDIGCSISIPFEVTAFEPNVFEREAYFRLSEQNSLITVKDEVIDNTTTFKNATNTLSYQEETQINYRDFKQLYQTTDGVIKQQYRSNYDTVNVKLIDCDGNESVLVPEQKTQNFDITDVRDVTILPVSYLDVSFVGVQYVTGNTYDPDTLAIGVPYNLSTETPDFMNIDDYIQIEGAGWFRVRDIQYYDGIETLVLDVLENSFPILVTGQTVKGTSIYNILPYEVYEVSFNCNTLSGDYYITYNASDSEFETVDFITEWFNVKDCQEDTYLLQYYNSENNETNYSTGIVNKIRIPYFKTITYLPNDTQDVYFTDTNAINIESTYRDFYSLEVKPIPQGFVRKLGLSVSNDRLFLNGLSLLKNQELEAERFGRNNLYRLTIGFVRSDYAFTNIANDGSIVIPSGQPLGLSGDSNGLLFAN
jgi:hypothetical protein